MRETGAPAPSRSAKGQAVSATEVALARCGVAMVDYRVEFGTGAQRASIAPALNEVNADRFGRRACSDVNRMAAEAGDAR